MRKFIFIILVPLIFFISCKNYDKTWAFINETNKDATLKNEFDEIITVPKKSTITYSTNDLYGSFELLNMPYNFRLCKADSKTYYIDCLTTTFNYKITNLNTTYDLIIIADDTINICPKSTESNPSINLKTYDTKDDYKFFFKTGVDSNNKDIYIYAPSDLYKIEIIYN